MVLKTYEEELELEDIGLALSLLDEEYPDIGKRSIFEIASIIHKEFNMKCSVIDLNEYFNPNQEEIVIGSEYYRGHGY